MPVTPSRTPKPAARRAPAPRKRASNGAPAAGVRRDLLAAEVLDKAASLFASQGFAATSLKDVADAVGLHRSSIYYYYPNKDALLKELMQGVTLPVSRIFREVEAEGLAPLAAIREVVRRLVLWVADPRTHFRLMDRSEAELPEAIAKVHRDAKRHVLGKMVGLIEAAALAGEARATDARVSALSIIGMAMWTAWWFQPNQGRTLQEVAEQVAESAAATVQRSGSSKKVSSVGDLTRAIRDDLDLIDRLTLNGKG